MKTKQLIPIFESPNISEFQKEMKGPYINCIHESSTKASYFLLPCCCFPLCL